LVKSHILKPYDAGRINRTVARMENALQRRGESIEALRAAVLELTQREKHRGGKLAVKDYNDGSLVFLDPSEITSAERVGRRTLVRTFDAVYPTYYPLDSVERHLLPDRFFRANRGLLVNLDHVGQMAPNGDGSYTIVLRDTSGTVMNVSRNHAKELLAAVRPQP